MRAKERIADTLKARLHELADRHAESSRIRIHRAISWLGRAEAETADPDARFVFLWIAFNAAYAHEFGEDVKAREQLHAFFVKALASDAHKRLAAVLFQQFSGPIRTLVENRFVFEPFWRALREHDSSDRWEIKFEQSKKIALQSIVGSETATVLSIVFDRLYVLRNQLIHGGATWNSGTNRAQVKDGANILIAIIPVVIGLMLDHPEVDFGTIQYPVVATA